MDIQKGYSRIGRLSSGRASKMLREIKAPKLVMVSMLGYHTVKVQPIMLSTVCKAYTCACSDRS